MKNRIVIIGGGPAGYEAALAGAKYGADVTVIEERGIGGSSVLLDCVPSKSFIAGTGIKTDLRRADDMGLNSLLGRARIHLPALNQRVKTLAQEQSDDIIVQLERAGVRFVHGRGRFAESQ
ncbi:MAG TPA: FAD-dependent oxidoreductase, partial [Corynebacterium sp.]|nr:FAD-dependent oxidoreductase [Corynebacterium sp.]